MPRIVNPNARRILNEVAIVTAKRNGLLDDDAIVLNLKSKTKQWKTRCRIEADFGNNTWVLDPDFRWDGASIPCFWQRLLGISRYDPRVALASAFHDDICNRIGAHNAQRVVGDAIFISLLMPIKFNGKLLPGVGPWMAVILYAGVRLYSGCRFAKRYLCSCVA